MTDGDVDTDVQPGPVVPSRKLSVHSGPDGDVARDVDTDLPRAVLSLDDGTNGADIDVDKTGKPLRGLPTNSGPVHVDLFNNCLELS